MEFVLENLKDGKNLEEFIEQNNLKLNKEKMSEFYQKEYAEQDIKETVMDFASRMIFAWDKAESCRGISASFNRDYLESYFKIFEREDLAEIITDDSLYDPYNAPAMIKVCEKLSIKVPEYLREFAGISYAEHVKLGHC